EGGIGITGLGRVGLQPPAVAARAGIDQQAQQAPGGVQQRQGKQGKGAEQGKQHAWGKAGRHASVPRYIYRFRPGSMKRAFSRKMAPVAELTDNLRGDARGAARASGKSR